MDWSSKYTPIDATDAVLRASHLYDDHDSQWNLPFVFALSNNDVTHAVVWDELCVRRLLPLCQTPNRDALLADLEMLTAMRVRLASEQEFAETGRNIWYRNSSREHFQTAVAQLYGIVGHELHPNGKRPLTYYGVGLSVIAAGEQFPDWVLRIAIEEFKSVEQMRSSGTLPFQILNLECAEHYGFRQRRDD
jgi:hypothetical protein